jgi:alkanesulfonate monooxygenase SsuD/methylene tetrahydromethanopterin reductase-like flavin-dependent oxidoreductase (luciferase family)
VKVGLTLPSFVTDPTEMVTVARAAESAGLDGVFVFDHLFRVDAGRRRRPAIEGVAALGAIAVATERVRIGTLVARASLRPAASLAVALETVARLAPGRLIAGIGAGDSASREENDAFGVPAGTAGDRVGALRAAVAAARDRGFPVWVAGSSAAVRTAAAHDADGWNQWGSAPTVFARHAAVLRRDAARSPFACTWGGLVLVADDDAAAGEQARRIGADPSAIVGGPDRVADGLARYVRAGADWVIAGPVSARDPRQAALLGEEVVPRLRGSAAAPVG